MKRIDIPPNIEEDLKSIGVRTRGQVFDLLKAFSIHCRRFNTDGARWATAMIDAYYDEGVNDAKARH